MVNRALRGFVAPTLSRCGIAILSFLLLALPACVTNIHEPLDAGMVVAPEPHAAKVGADILRRGGNAVDAAVAVQFALAVTYPTAGNIGGGGFMSIYGLRKGAESPSYLPWHFQVLDYRETAPAAASRDMYLDSSGNADAKASLESHRAAGIPGTVRGMWDAHQQFGHLPWRDLLHPAIELADVGFELDAWTANSFAEQVADIAKREPRFREVCNFGAYFHGKACERLRQPELADTLRRIADQGPAGFYERRTADLIVAEMRRGGGLITLDDLKSYTVKWRAPLEFNYRGLHIVTMPPPSSGGIALAQMLTMFEQFKKPLWGTTAHLHLVAEIEKRVFADRSVYGGDPDFITVPVKELTDPAYCKCRAAEVNQTARTDPSTIQAGTFAVMPTTNQPPRHETHHTTHFSIVDKYGMAVSNTTTLNDAYGSGIVVTGAGFLLNNEMDDFSAKPGTRNMYGVTGGEANSIAPGKRMLSSMSPTFVFKPDGKLWLILGTPGGPTIFTSVFQVIVNRIDYGMTLPDAVNAPRFHHQWPPSDDGDSIRVDQSDANKFDASTLRDLESLGYKVKQSDGIGDVQAIEIDGRRAMGAPDRRNIGRAERE